MSGRSLLSSSPKIFSSSLSPSPLSNLPLPGRSSPWRCRLLVLAYWDALTVWVLENEELPETQSLEVSLYSKLKFLLSNYLSLAHPSSVEDCCSLSTQSHTTGAEVLVS